jgi:hypothetical protein
MIIVHVNAETSSNPLLDMAWVILEAANDLGDSETVETCRRVIDATFCNVVPARSDIDHILDYF